MKREMRRTLLLLDCRHRVRLSRLARLQSTTLLSNIQTKLHTLSPSDDGKIIPLPRSLRGAVLRNETRISVNGNWFSARADGRSRV